MKKIITIVLGLALLALALTSSMVIARQPHYTFVIENKTKKTLVIKGKGNCASLTILGNTMFPGGKKKFRYLKWKCDWLAGTGRFNAIDKVLYRFTSDFSKTQWVIK